MTNLRPFEIALHAVIFNFVFDNGMEEAVRNGKGMQYFEDKKDLFLYLMGLIAAEKVNYLSPVSSNPEEHDIFTVIREMFLSGVQFAKEHPRYAAIGNMLLANKQAPIYRELQAESRPISFALFEPLIEQAIARGEVRADIDVQLLNYMITSMNVSIAEYSSERHPQTMVESVVESVDAYMDILKNGIGAKADS